MKSWEQFCFGLGNEYELARTLYDNRKKKKKKTIFGIVSLRSQDNQSNDTNRMWIMNSFFVKFQ